MRALKLAFERFSRLVDWFVPAELAADRTMRKQAQMFLVSHICGPFIGNSVPLAVYLLDPKPGYANIVLATSITGFWIFPFLLKVTRQYNALAIVSIQNLMFCIIWSCLMLGGIQSPTVPWVLTIPLLSFFYLGSAPDIRLMVLLMFMANFTAFWLVSGEVVIEPSHIGTVPAQALGVVSTVAAAMYIAMMALFYAKALASQGELEAEMRDHISTARDLRRAAAEADRADEIKAAFLTSLSGELRIPLHAVIGYSSILIEETESAPEIGDACELRTIRDAGMDLLRFVNDILDLSRIEAGRMEIFSDVFDPAELLQGVVDEMTPSATANGNTLALHFGGELGLIASDMRKVRVVLIQLISNAVKFTTDGRIDVHAHLKPRDATGPASLVFSVADTGVGIDASRLPKLFEQFALNNDARASKYGGSGLGLALSRKLCRLLGGSIEVETKRGQGTRFTVSIPATPVAVDQPAEPAEVERLDAARIEGRPPREPDTAVRLREVA